MRPEQPRRMVEGEVRGTLLPPLAEGLPKLGVGPDPMQLALRIRDVVGVEEETGVADHVGKPGRIRRNHGKTGIEGLADRQPPTLEPARENQRRSQLIEPAELERADEARERCGAGQSQPLDELTDVPVVAGLLPRADQRNRYPALVPDPGDGLEQALVVLVAPGLCRLEQEGLRL